MSDEGTRLPPNFADSVRDFKDLLIDLIDRGAAVGGAGARRWIDGLDGKDIELIADDAAANSKQFAAKAWEVAEKNVKPDVPRPAQEGDA
jgi:hypothetical protein